jgi:hypothetical protein
MDRFTTKGTNPGFICRIKGYKIADREALN